MGNFLRFVGGLALGFAAGAGIVALLTPRAGTEVQADLRQHVDSAGKSPDHSASSRQQKATASTEHGMFLSKVFCGE
jgi:hypothetical protein